MPKTEPVTFEQLVLCEDIRREDNGKFMLMGVFSEGIVFSSLPISTTLAFWVVLTLQGKAETLLVELKISIPGRKEDHIIKADIEMSGVSTFPKTIPLVIGKMPFEFLEEGTASISMRFGKGKKWQKIRDFSIKKRPK